MLEHVGFSKKTCEELRSTTAALWALFQIKLSTVSTSLARKKNQKHAENLRNQHQLNLCLVKKYVLGLSNVLTVNGITNTTGYP